MQEKDPQNFELGDSDENPPESLEGFLAELNVPFTKDQEIDIYGQVDKNQENSPKEFIEQIEKINQKFRTIIETTSKADLLNEMKSKLSEIEKKVHGFIAEAHHNFEKQKLSYFLEEDEEKGIYREDKNLALEYFILNQSQL